MVSLKILNCVLNGRTNQNTTVLFSKLRYGFKRDEVVPDEWLLANMDSIFAGVIKTKNTKIKDKVDSDIK